MNKSEKKQIFSQTISNKLEINLARKGIIDDIFSKAKYADDAKLYKIYYRDFESIRETTLLEFIKESNNFQTIPITRIIMIKKNNRILFEKNKKRLNRFGNS
jgi:uncharacterized protein (UPF0248 family)